MPDYNNYVPDKRTLIEILASGIIICLAAGWLFFDSLWGMIFATAYLPIHIKVQKNKRHKAKLEKLRLEFKDFVNSMAAALEAGYSVENAIKESISELSLLYDDNSMIIIELKEIVRKLNNNINIETALWDFAMRSNIDDIIYFAEVFITAKRSGGNILYIIRNTRTNICDKIELGRELASLIAAKLYEVKIMKLVPLGLIGYLKIFNYEMIAPLYTGIIGNILMAAVLAGYLGLCRLADQITNKAFI